MKFNIVKFFMFIDLWLIKKFIDLGLVVYGFKSWIFLKVK